MNKKRLLVISIDALNAKDLDYIKKLPNFSSVINEGSLVESVEPVYPSMTYCCHTSIITGTLPCDHGIFNNTIFNPEKYLDPDWYWTADSIKVPTIFHLAKEKGLKTSTILWPVMASSITDYNIAEIWSNKGESSFKLFLKHGSKKLLPYVIKHQHLLDGTKQPNVDNFSEAISIDIITKKKPELMFIHYTELDSTRHTEGIFSDEAYRILDKMDQRIGTIFDAMKKAGTYENTTIILLGDHGGAEVTHAVSLNLLFFKEGLITLAADDESIVAWKAFANTCGGSVQIHLEDPSNANLVKKVEDILSKICVMPNTPIKRMYTAEEVSDIFGVTGSFSYMLEGKNGYIFKNAIYDKLITPRHEIEGIYKGEHGFLPTHPDLKTLFMIKGENIKKGHTIKSAQLYDEAPTMAKVLGLQFPNKIKGSLLDVFQ